ncbi:MAG: 16S rRNA (adenine(1518)-N(6)/adenine(1519)-N(6))-dimethyltransferase RsmA [Smithella sp.]
MNTPKDIIKQYNIKPRKKLSQSFLIDQNILKKIANAAQITKDDIVVEIGSGIGVLTELLAHDAGKLIAVELDQNLVAILKEKFANYPNVEIYSGDILKFDYALISNKYNRKLKVVGNVPYNISSPVVFQLLAFRKVINNFILMLQKEVVERLIALPDNKNYGVPSVLLQMFASVEKVFDVPASCFYPQPKVESAVIKGIFLNKPLIELDETFFTKLVKAAFAQRRKTLINNLKNAKFLQEFSTEILMEALSNAGIEGRRRGETLSVKEFGHLSNNLISRSH